MVPDSNQWSRILTSIRGRLYLSVKICENGQSRREWVLCWKEVEMFHAQSIASKHLQSFIYRRQKKMETTHTEAGAGMWILAALSDR